MSRYPIRLSIGVIVPPARLFPIMDGVENALSGFLAKPFERIEAICLKPVATIFRRPLVLYFMVLSGCGPKRDVWKRQRIVRAGIKLEGNGTLVPADLMSRKRLPIAFGSQHTERIF